MNDKEQILQLVKNYQKAIHTQNREDFKSIWTEDENNVLISIATQYRGIDSICQDFLIDGIQKAYAVIDLIAENVDIHFIDESTAIVVFRYHTECIRRDSGENYGIAGLETQVVRKTDGKWKLVHIHYSKA
ncbi:MAG: YybH family protein [Bulleidia sp.]